MVGEKPQPMLEGGGMILKGHNHKLAMLSYVGSSERLTGFYVMMIFNRHLGKLHAGQHDNRTQGS